MDALLYRCKTNFLSTMLYPLSSRGRGCLPLPLRLAFFVVCALLLTQASRGHNITSSIVDDDSKYYPLKRTTDIGQGDEIDFEKALRNFVASAFASVPKSLGRKLLEADVRPECTVGLLRTMKGFQNLEPWALRLLDASGKLPNGLLQGSRADMGAFDECLETVVLDSFGGALTRGQYCNLYIYFTNGTAIEERIMSASSALHPKLIYYKDYFSVPELPLLRIALCFVDDCSQRDLQALVDSVKLPLVRVEVSNCVTVEPESWSNPQIAIAVVFSLLIIAVMSGTVVEHFAQRKPQWKKDHCTLYEISKAFSATSNTQLLLKVADKADADQYALQFLHGMRFFSLAYIVFGHCGQTISDSCTVLLILTYYRGIPSGVTAARLLNMFIESHHWYFMLLTAAFNSVGTFFFLSEFFLSLTLSKQKATGPVVFVIGLLRRLIRTCVPLFFVVMCMYLLPLFVTGPDTQAFYQKFYSEMNRHGWHLLLQIRNFFYISPSNVVIHFWYLSADFQLFTISLLVLLLFKSRRMLAVAVFCLLSLIGCSIGTWVVASRDLSPFILFPGPILQVMLKTSNGYYFRPYYHGVCFFSGCGTFLVIEDFKKRQLSKAVLCAGWVVAVSCALLCIFMKLAWYRSPEPTSQGVTLLAAFFDRVLWSVFLVWITLACSSGRGGPVGKFLSWSAFVPLSKLSYGVYLIHLPFLELLLHASRERLYWSIFYTVTRFFAVVVWSFLLAYLAFVLCEAPTGALDKLLFGRMSRRGSSSKRQPYNFPEKTALETKNSKCSRC